MVNVGKLIEIKIKIDEKWVNKRWKIIIIEGLMRNEMEKVKWRIEDGEKDREIKIIWRVKWFKEKWLKMKRIIWVMEKIGDRL